MFWFRVFKLRFIINTTLTLVLLCVNHQTWQVKLKEGQKNVNFADD